ncbi:M56 family metallopeptidase [uncultured Pontibacter sp.]|uniref:M56 family metallopeptidase n=1 Tax=uncultured Pontibacter sp. TaxID=453356 RepID=UPI00260C809E|nr:M56 family metallopeptidase [uncultured Pontibacter sp.]
MPESILYLLKANAALLLFYLAYRLLLRRLTFYTYNRAYLLTALLISAIIPLLDLSAFYTQPSQIGHRFVLLLPEWSGKEVAEQGQEQNYWHWLVLLYFGGGLVMAARFILQAVSLWQVHRSSTFKIWNGHSFRELKEKISPFSFWRSIYLNPKQHSEQELKALLLHEQVHVQQLHTLDILLAQLACVVYWFNPVTWLLQQDVRQNLEYIADRKVLDQGVDSRSYQYSLLHVGQQQLNENSLIMSFNFNHIKDRIMMMNKQEINPLHKLKYLLLTPAVLALALFATTSRAEVELAAEGLSQSITSTPQDTTVNKASVSITSIPQEGIVYLVDGNRMAADKINSINPEKIVKIDVLKGERAQTLLADNTLKGVVAIMTEAGQNSSEAKEMRRKIKSINASAGVTDTAVLGYVSGKEDFLAAPSEAIYILNGKEISYKEMQAINPKDIATVDVLKDENALQKYGEKGKNGVVIIYTKK